MAALDWSQCPAVESVPGKVSGAWVFKGTRMPVQTVFENLEAGMSVDEITEVFDVTREEVSSGPERAMISASMRSFTLQLLSRGLLVSGFQRWLVALLNFLSAGKEFFDFLARLRFRFNLSNLQPYLAAITGVCAAHGRARQHQNHASLRPARG